MPKAASIYDHPEIYDLAFSYRDYTSECDFLLDTYRKERGTKPRHFLEIAAGPAGHALSMAEKGVRSSALDLSEAMCSYGRKLAQERNLDLDYIRADMTNFDLNRSFDLVATMLDSLSHLTTPEQLQAHFDAVAKHIASDGLYVIEAPHPKGLFQNEETTQDTWQMEKAEQRVQMSWGEKEPLDPVTQVVTYQAAAVYTHQDKKLELEESVLSRIHTLGEFQLAMNSAGLSLLRTYGDFEGATLHAPDAWRMILVIGKK